MSTIINAKVQHKRGTESSIPTLMDGQIYLPYDARKIYKGTTTGNQIVFDDTEMVKKTKGVINYYVNSSTGADTNTGLSSIVPFRTIQKAISMIPQVCNHTVNINLAIGTYDEDVTLDNFLCNTINIIGGNGLNSDYNVKHIVINNCNNVSIKGINFTANNSSVIFVTNCKFINLINLRCITTFSGDTIYSTSSTVVINTAEISNRQYVVRASNLSNILASGLSGSANYYGLVAQMGSTIVKDGTQASATNAEVAQNGGVVR